ncbi:hypothetical protein Neosp_003501 [[Neocosmospora] mangrovei]
MSFIEMSFKVPTATSQTGKPTEESIRNAFSVPDSTESSPLPSPSAKTSRRDMSPEGETYLNKVPPVVRLEVWHFSKTCGSFKHRRYLADTLSQIDLPGWQVQPSNSTPAEDSRRDEFVPAMVVKVVSKSRRQAAYDRSSAAFKCYQELETVLDLDCKKHFEPNDLGHQDLYFSIVQMAIAFQIVPFYRKEREEYLKRFFRTTRRILCLASPFVAATACAYFWTKRRQFDELSWDWAMDKYSYWDTKYQYTIYWKNSNAMGLISLLALLINLVEYFALRFFNKRTDKKINDLRVTQGALVAKFCSRVMKAPPDIMTATERKKAFYFLGVNFHDETPETQRRCLDAFQTDIVQH